MDAYIEQNALGLDNFPSQDRIQAQGLLDSRRELTGKILDLFPCPVCNDHLYYTADFRKTAKGLGFKFAPVPIKKKHCLYKSIDFTTGKSLSLSPPLADSHTENRFEPPFRLTSSGSALFVLILRVATAKSRSAPVKAFL
ncbi:hypothetical protein NPIL_422871 [Nephila pilipes]|uniref:Uncharacterized protein n=1 Tax=Nephila pilipes TaxID=299642 RepID=A0A8X6MLA7_NEPPI|nr:hypothetical protein NPIL_422871 [Nephila pilipes]